MFYKRVRMGVKEDDGTVVFLHDLAKSLQNKSLKPPYWNKNLCQLQKRVILAVPLFGLER